MVTRSDGKKISQFLAQDTVLSGAFFDYVANGTNYKISRDNLAANIGVTGALPVIDSDGVQYNLPLVDANGGSGRGSIKQAGADTGTPILDLSGSISYIRNVENGAGITSSVSPENGLTLSHNFTVDTDGVPLMLNTTAASPTFTSLVAGSGASVQASGNTIVISATGLITPKTVVVSQLSDFPTAVGGIITLEADTEYALVNDVNIGTSRILMQEGTAVTGQGAGITTLTYTGTGAMFTWVDADIEVSRCSLSCANGTLVNGTGPATDRYAYFSYVGVNACQSIGTVTGVYYLGISYCAFSSIAVDGITIAGNNGLIDFSHSQFVISAGTLFKLGASTMDSFNATNCIFSPTVGSIGLISGLASSGNVNNNGTGRVVDNAMTGHSMTLSGVALGDSRWIYRNTDRIRDTEPDALLYMQGNATATTIASTSVPVLVAGTWSIDSAMSMTGTAAGRITYTGDKDAKLPISVTLTLNPSSGSNQDISVYIAKNGTVINGSRMSRNISSGSPVTMPCQWQLLFAKNDYVEVFVQNATATNSIVVSRIVFRVN